MKPRFISAGSIPVTVSPRAVAANSAALTSMGETISVIGNQGLQLADKVRRIDEAGKLSELMLKADETASSFSAELMTRHDPDKWKDAWSQHSQKIKAGVGELGLSPEGRAQAEQRINDWAGRTMIRFEGQAAIKAIELGKNRILNSAQHHFSRGEIQEGRGFLQQGGELGILSPDEVEKGFMLGDEIAARERLVSEIEFDPKEAIARLESGEFLEANPGADLRLVEAGKRMAASRIQEYRTQEMDALETALMKGQISGADLEAAQYITEKDRAAIAGAITQSVPPSNEDHAKAWDLLTTLREAREDGGITADQYRELWNEARGSLLHRVPPAWAGDIRKELSYLSPAGRETSGLPETAKAYEQADLEAVGRNVAFRARDAGLFGPIDEDAPPADREQAFRKAEDVRLDVKRWLASQKKQPTPQEVREYTDGLISGDRIKTTVRDFIPRIPGTGASLKPQAFQIPATPSTFGLTTATREKLPPSTPQARQVSLDFNDAANKEARGVEIIIPDDATDEERKAAEAYVKRTADFFAKHGVAVPVRGVKTRTENGRGTPGRFHTEPFFVGHKEAVAAIQQDPDGYADVLAGTLGRLPGINFIAPHQEHDPGATRGNLNERDFARSTILPALRRRQANDTRRSAILQKLDAFLSSDQ